MWFSFAHSWFELHQEKFNWKKKISFEKHLIFETWKFWNFHLKSWDFETLRFWIEIWNLKPKILKLRILKTEPLNFDYEIWGLNFLKTEDLSLEFGHCECKIENLGMKIWILKRICFFLVDGVNSIWLSWLSFGWV